MLKENIKLAFRNLIKDKLYFTINILGLAIGIVFSLFITIYVQDELSFDRHYKNSDNIYRLTQKYLDDGTHFARCAPAYAPLLKDYFPEIKHIVRLNHQANVINIENRKYNEKNFFFADSNFFNVFSFKFKIGNPENSINEPFSVVLSERTAKKYFGNKNPLNESIQIVGSEGNKLYKVTGVIEDFKRNSHFHADIIASFSSQETDFSSRWYQMGNFYTYLTLPDKYDYSSLEEKIPDFLRAKMAEEAPNWISMHLQPLKSIHLKSKLQREIEKNGDIKVVYIFIVISIFVLLIASINYINLSIARSSKRADEIGLRKILGANKKTIIKQFFGESFLICLMVLIISVILIGLLFTPFNDIIDKKLELFSIANISIFIELIVLIIFVGFVAGIYPAIVLSSFKPLSILKRMHPLMKGTTFRKALIIFQFAISSLLIICSMIVFSQIRFMEQKDLGFSKENTVVIKDIELGDRYNTLKNELLTESSNVDVTAVMSPPSVKILDMGKVYVEGFQFNTEQGSSLIMSLLPVQMNFPEFLDMEFLAGRSFSEEFRSDSVAYIINEIALRKIGWANANEAIGKQFMVNNLPIGLIIGVVKDFNYSSLQDQADPFVLFYKKDWLFTVLIRTKTDQTSESISHVKETLDEIYPNKLFEITTLDDLFQELYTSEKKQMKILIVFSILAVLISCMGLFGLLSFIIEQKTKEIGIRKVNGASVIDIVLLFFREFTILIFIGNVISILIGYYIMKSWLQNFAYHTDIKIWIFAFALFVTIIITYLTVSYFTIRAATANPIKAIKYE